MFSSVSDTGGVGINSDIRMRHSQVSPDLRAGAGTRPYQIKRSRNKFRPTRRCESQVRRFAPPTGWELGGGKRWVAADFSPLSFLEFWVAAGFSLRMFSSVSDIGGVGINSDIRMRHSQASSDLRAGAGTRPYQIKRSRNKFRPTRRCESQVRRFAPPTGWELGGGKRWVAADFSPLSILEFWVAAGFSLRMFSSVSDTGGVGINSDIRMRHSQAWSDLRAGAGIRPYY